MVLAGCPANDLATVPYSFDQFSQFGNFSSQGFQLGSSFMVSTVMKFVLVVSLPVTTMVFVLFGVSPALDVMTVIVFVFQSHGFCDNMTGGSC